MRLFMSPSLFLTCCRTVTAADQPGNENNNLLKQEKNKQPMKPLNLCYVKGLNQLQLIPEIVRITEHMTGRGFTHISS